MPVWLALVLAGLNGAAALRDIRVGVGLYAFLALVAPHADIGVVKLQYEILALPFVLLPVVFQKREARHPHLHYYLLVYFAVVSISTLRSAILYDTAVEWIRYAGHLRWLILIALFVECLDRRSVKAVVVATLAVNLFVAGIQIVFPGSAEVFLQLYGRESQEVLERFATEGLIPRAMGTLESPVNLGAFSLLGFSIGATEVLRDGPTLERWGLLIGSVGCGVMSLTKTFYLGAPLMTAVVLMLLVSPTRLLASSLRVKPRRMLIYGLVAATIVVAVGAAAVWLRERGLSVLYYASFIFDPGEAFATRYGFGGMIGGLATTMEVITRNWVLGVGMTTPANEFIGDSTYIVLLHHAGIVGAIMFLAGLVSLINYCIVKHRTFDLVVLAAIVAAGFGVPLLFYLMGALALSFVIADVTDADSPVAASVARSTTT